MQNMAGFSSPLGDKDIEFYTSMAAEKELVRMRYFQGKIRQFLGSPKRGSNRLEE